MPLTLSLQNQKYGTTINLLTQAARKEGIIRRGNKKTTDNPRETGMLLRGKFIICTHDHFKLCETIILCCASEADDKLLDRFTWSLRN